MSFLLSVFRPSRRKPPAPVLAVPAQPVIIPGTPFGTDWMWRPDLWAGTIEPDVFDKCETGQRIGTCASVFHDCAQRDLKVSQVGNSSNKPVSPFAVQFEVGDFSGSFLSLALDLPDTAVRDMQKRHLFRLEADVECDAGISIYARLNIKHGPNTEKVLQHVPAGSGTISAEFDLAYTQLNVKRVEKIWLDLIFEDPSGKTFTLQNARMIRRPRSEL